jgi:hypothetical protein
MRIIAFIFGMLSTAWAAQTWALDWGTISINQNPVPAEALVSFSIGYPKGWQASEDPAIAYQDIYDNVVVSPHRYDTICSFNPNGQTNLLQPPGIASCSIWPAGDMTAKEAAEAFFKDTRSPAKYSHKHLSPVTTSARDSGWLVESKGTLRFYPTLITNGMDFFKLEKSNSKFEIIPVVYHDFFFRSGSSHGNKEAIRIEIITQATDSSCRSELDHLVLKTLLFSDAR